MKIQRWLEWKFVKEGFINLFWNFHYIVIFGLIGLGLCLGIITIGPVLLALASSTRLIAEDQKINIGYFFKELKRLFVPGLALSLVLLIGLLSLRASFIILTFYHAVPYRIAAYTAIAVVTMVFFFMFYYPFTGFKENNTISMFVKSWTFTLGHLWSTVVQISMLYLLWRLLSISIAIAVVLFLPMAAYMTNRFILANNQSVDEQNDYETAK